MRFIPRRLRRGKSILCVLILFSLSFPQRISQARPLPWTTAKTVSGGSPQSIGGYAYGCLQGGHSLPPRGVGYEDIRRHRNRYHAHPKTVHLVKELGRAVHKRGLLPIEVGDLSQPRGGRMKYGHRSHQSGLDADIWFGGDRSYRMGERLRRMKRTQRTSKRKQWSKKKLKRALFDVDHPSVVKGWREILDKKVWSTRHEQLLEMAASRPEVARVFVHFRIKEKMCERYQSMLNMQAKTDIEEDHGVRENTKSEPLWLRKLRPWYGHHQHFHIRLHCPKDSPECDPQGPLPKGLGCEGLEWFSKREKSARKKAAKELEAAEIVRRAQLSSREVKALKRAETKTKKARHLASKERQETLNRRCQHLSPLP